MGKRRIKQPQNTEPTHLPSVFSNSDNSDNSNNSNNSNNFNPINYVDTQEQLIEKGCTSKDTYNTKEHADSQALYIRTTKGVPVYSYKCLYCDYWHIGHRY